MSLILDALKKADSARDNASHSQTEEAVLATLPLHGDSTAAYLPAKVISRAFFIYGLLVLLICCGFYLLYLWANPPTSITPSFSQKHSSPALLPQVTVINTEAKTQIAANTPNHSTSNEINALYNQVKTAPADAKKNTPNAIASLYSDVKPVNTNTHKHVALNQHETTKKPETTKKTKSAFAATPTFNAYAQVQTLNALPTSLQATIPTLLYTQHQYYENERSSVTLNKRTLYAGDNITEQLKLEAILKDGIIIKTHATMFKLQARNSWVNL